MTPANCSTKSVKSLFARYLSLLFVFAHVSCLAIFVAGCGGDSTPPPPPAITVSVSPSAAVSIDQAQTKAFTATVSNDVGAKGVTWTVAGGGTLSNTTTGAATFNAPASVAANLTVTLTATSVSDATKSASVKITVTPLPAITSTSLVNATVGTAYSVTLQMTGGVSPFTWSIASGTLPAGLSLNASTGVISGTPTAPGTSNLTFQVTDSGSPAISATSALTITVDAASLTISTTSLPNGTIGAAYTGGVQATGGTQPYTFTITVGALPAGLAINSATGAITGTPSAAATSNFTVHVTDSSGPAQSADKALSITVNPSGPNDSLLNGTYALSFTGWDASGYLAMAGSFIADGAGAVTGGVLDLTRHSGVSTNISITGGSFTIAADNRGSLTLISSLGTWTFRMSVDATGQKARFIQFDASATRGSGLIKKQNTSQFATALAGDFAFGMTGYDDAANRTSADGALTAASGNISSGSLDASTSGASTGQIAISGGVISAASGSAGRGTLSVNATITGLPATTTYAYYMVSSTELFFVNINPLVDSVPRFTGSLLKQNKPGGGFALSSLNGAAVFRFSALDTSHSQTNVAIGQIVPNGSGTITSASLDQNADGVITTGTSSGSYTMTSSGRGVVSITGIRQEVVYLVDLNTGFLVEGTTVDPGNDVGLGFFEPQTSTVAPSGTYVLGTIDPTNAQANDLAGSLTAGAGSPPLSGTLDSSDFPSTLTPDQAFTAVYTTTIDSKGRAAATITPTGGSPIPVILWVISPNKFVAIVADATQTETSLLVIEK
ncbi:MAG TPA: putative Ig domain-containing protein [Candidatus Acidoferrum sp.]|nr:putative Ig domain-containing protein [Candidatus Acidoferrum sp.]